MEAVAKQNNGMAIASLVLSILAAITFCLFFPAFMILGIPALITGIIGHRQIKASGGTQTGRWMAIVGIVIGVVSVLAWIAVIVIAILALLGPQIANIFSRVTSGVR